MYFFTSTIFLQAFYTRIYGLSVVSDFTISYLTYTLYPLLYLCYIVMLSVSVILVNSIILINYADRYAEILGRYR